MKHMISQHAEKRMQQRGFRHTDLDVLHQCGTRIDDNSFLLTNQDAAREIAARKREIHALERLKGSKIVVSEQNVITVYRTTRKHRKIIKRRFQ